MSQKREQLAKYAHEAWSGWMEYVFSKAAINDDGTITLPKWAVDRWKRQVNSSYKELSEEEKESDRSEADKMINIMSKKEITEELFEYTLIEIDKIMMAKQLARDVHKGQWRKKSPLPFIVHPLRVYHRIKKMGFSKVHQLVAILHDTVEDSPNPPLTIKKIKELFGSKVVKLILYLSHDKNVNYNVYLLNLAKMSSVALDVKMLDMLDNLIDSPSKKQLLKYAKALYYLEENGVEINSKIKNKLYQYVKK